VVVDRLILASASPRRRELLHGLLPSFEVSPSRLNEPRYKPAGIDARAWAEALAYFKARSVAEEQPNCWTLGADTVVRCDGQLLGKPRNAADARRMLYLQAGRPSEVITGVCLVRIAETIRRIIRSAVTRVWMRPDPAEIEKYVESGDWQGKAGAYGIQDVGDRLVERIEGSFSNVVGLPVETVGGMLRELADSARPRSA
jgi:septum formation protein